MKFEYTSKIPRYGKVIGRFNLIDDGVPFDEEEFVTFAKRAMGDDAPFGYTVSHGPTTASLTVYTD